MTKTVPLLALAACLAGCIPYVYPVLPGARSDSRTNIGNAVPTFIVIGKSTREDVLLSLGEPDGVGASEEWVSYGAARRRGGVGFGFVADNGGIDARLKVVEFRRLLVRFDTNNVVSEATMRIANCSESTFNMDHDSTTAPCLDVSGRDIPIGAMQAELESAGAKTYRGSHWREAGCEALQRQSFRGTDYGRSQNRDIVVGPNSIVLFTAKQSRQPTATRVLHPQAIDAEYRYDSMRRGVGIVSEGHKHWIVLQRSELICNYIALYGPSRRWLSQAQTENIRLELERRIVSATPVRPAQESKSETP
jgi:hypothetical protein